MINGRIAVYILIISYVITLGHNFIPHHHYHEDHKKSAHSHYHHHHHNLPTEDDEKEGNDVLISIFGSMLHHDDGKFVLSSSENEGKSLSSGNTFGLCCSNTVFENFPIKNSRKHTPENKNYYRLHQKISHGLRAPPHTLV